MRGDREDVRDVMENASAKREHVEAALAALETLQQREAEAMDGTMLPQTFCNSRNTWLSSSWQSRAKKGAHSTRYGNRSSFSGWMCFRELSCVGRILKHPILLLTRGSWIWIGAKTLHSALRFTPDTSLRTAALELTPQRRAKLGQAFLPAGAVLKDDFSMDVSSLLNNKDHAVLKAVTVFALILRQTCCAGKPSCRQRKRMREIAL